MRLYISVPSNRDWKAKFGLSLARLTSHLTQLMLKPDPPFALETFLLQPIINASCLSIVRQRFVDEIIEGGFTHWLSLDDDMMFPSDIVDRLIAHGKDIVAINARHKCAEIKGSLMHMDGSNLVSTDKAGLEEIRNMGGAIFLAKASTFKDIPRPHFQVVWSEAHANYVSEDVHFAALLKANGVQLWCDHDTSQLVTHIGEHEYSWPVTKE